MSKFNNELTDYEKEKIHDYVVGLEPKEREYLIQQLFKVERPKLKRYEISEPDKIRKALCEMAAEDMRGW